MNYRLMTQARYGAEAGIHTTANSDEQLRASSSRRGCAAPMPAGYNIIVPVPAACGDSPV